MKTFCKSDGARSSLDGVYDDIILSFQDLIKTIQANILTERRKTDNKMCNEKIRKGPEIFNFTTKQIPPSLQEHLASGLNNVPHLKPVVNRLKPEIEKEAVLSCINAFVSIMGYYPRVSENTNLNQTIINLLSQAPSNSELGHRLVVFREQYVKSVPTIIL